MGLILTATFGFIIWICLWAVGAKSFDAFMITTIVITIGATGRMLVPFIPGKD